MSCLEHLLENGLCRLAEGRSYKEWRDIMLEDSNWQYVDRITMDDLWTICQYVIYTYTDNRKDDEYGDGF